MADKFGYALAYNREPATAVQAGFEQCLLGGGSSHKVQSPRVESVVAKNIQPNDTGLLTLIECVIAFDEDTRISVNLIVAKNGEDMFLYLEDFNALA